MRGQRRANEGQRGTKGSKAYSILGFRVPTTPVGAWDEGVKGSEGVKGEQKGVKGGQRGAKGNKGKQSIFYSRF